MCLPLISSTGVVTSPSASIPAPAISTTPPLYETPTPPPPPPPPPQPFSKPPITRFFKRRPKIPTDLSYSSTTSASPDEPAVDTSTANIDETHIDEPAIDTSNANIDETHIVSDDVDELQAGPRYNLRDYSTIHPEDKYGFSSMNAVVSEPVTSGSC